MYTQLHAAQLACSEYCAQWIRMLR